MSRVRLSTAFARALRFFGGLCILAAVGLLQAQTPVRTAESVCPADVLVQSAGCTVALTPGQTMDLPLAVAEGKTRMLTAEQTEGAIELRVLTPGPATEWPDPLTNQAGAHSRIVALVAAGERVAISNASKDKPASVLLTCAPERTADASGKLERAAERAFAHAELLRVKDTQDPTAAISAYDEAIAAWQNAGNQTAKARALIWKADFLVNNEGEPQLAPAVIDGATPALAELDPIEAAHYWMVMAFIHVVRGEYDATQDAYRRSVALYEAAGDASHQAKILDNSARVELMQGHADTAIDDEKRAAGLAATAGDSRRQAFVQEELGAIYSTKGDSEAAYRAYGEALQALKHLPPEPRMEAAIWVDLSDLYITLADLARAQDALDQASAIWKTTNYAIGTVDTLNNYGDLFLLKGSPREARRYFERGLVLAAGIDYERGSISLLSGMGDSFLYERDAAHAEQVLTQALARAQKAKQTDSEMQIHCQLGDLALLRHDGKRAAEEYATCSQQAVAANDAYTRIRAEGGLARTAFENGDLDKGQMHCENALGMIEATRGGLRNQDLKTSFFASQHAYYDLDIQILQRLDHAHPGQGYAWQAFLVAERARARTLLDQVTANGPRRGASPALLALYDDVQRRLRRLEAAQGAPGTKTRTARAANSTLTSIEQFTLSEHQLQSEIADAGRASEVTLPPVPLTLKSLQEALPQHHAILLEYWTGEMTTYVWRISLTGIRSFVLPPVSDLNRLCANYRKAVLSSVSSDPTLSAEQRDQMQNTQEASVRGLGLQLSHVLLPHGMLLPGTSTAFVVSDGPIQALPFAALPVAAKAPGSDVAFLSEPSATIFSIIEAASAAAHPMRVAVFADESASTGPSGEVRVSSGGASPAFARLPYTGEEAVMIRSVMGADATRLFPSAQVSQSTLQSLDWSQFSIAHFAMHAVLNEQYADLSGLSLGQERGGATKNFLWYGDVCRLQAPLDLVVLSACNTALGEQVPGEGLRGLTQAFFAAGARRVVGTLWQVDDQATSEWMRHFYGALRISHSPVKAMHEAQRSMAADPQWSAPYYWASFVLSGDWRSLP